MEADDHSVRSGSETHIGLVDTATLLWMILTCTSELESFWKESARLRGTVGVGFYNDLEIVDLIFLDAGKDILEG
jgi:hypothetical protein